MAFAWLSVYGWLEKGKLNSSSCSLNSSFQKWLAKIGSRSKTMLFGIPYNISTRLKNELATMIVVRSEFMAMKYAILDMIVVLP